ncbi:MAG TPA: hypothetical protein VFO40_26130 [Chthoniobacterales bacterium]|nr:hypothetical protein [Chthoniobacterales bacterium]
MKDLSIFTTGDGCRIAYRFDGPVDSPVLVLSKSIGTTLNMWDKQIPDLSKHFRVFAMTLGATAPRALQRGLIRLIDSDGM